MQFPSTFSPQGPLSPHLGGSFQPISPPASPRFPVNTQDSFENPRAPPPIPRSTPGNSAASTPVLSQSSGPPMLIPHRPAPRPPGGAVTSPNIPMRVAPPAPASSPYQTNDVNGPRTVQYTPPVFDSQPPTSLSRSNTNTGPSPYQHQQTNQTPAHQYQYQQAQSISAAQQAIKQDALSRSQSTRASPSIPQHMTSPVNEVPKLSLIHI